MDYQYDVALLAEFASLCGAPKDLDLDGQVMLFEEYQRALEVEIEDKFKKNTTEEECEKIVNDFICQWVAKKKEYFKNAKGKSTSKAPPEAYAAFVRIYMDWMEKPVEGKEPETEKRTAEDQRDLVRKSVWSANLNHKKFAKAGESFSNSILYGAEFDEYVDEVYVKFLEKCSDVDKFADYLEKDFKSRYKKFNGMNMGLDKLYPSLNALLRRPAQNMMGSLYNSTKKGWRYISIDAERENDGPSVLETLNVHNLTMEELLLNKAVVEQVQGMLNEEDNKILELTLGGYTQEQIGEEIGKKKATVSRHWKKIQQLIQQVDAETDNV